jgi:prepilin-type N-terminal cleavage/methylation domain-containing protein
MPMWASSRRADSWSYRAAAGFSLLELLVVLFLISVLAAMVAPRLQRTYQAVVSSGERAETVRSIENLPFAVRQTTLPLALQPGDAAGFAAWVPLPEGWSVTPVSGLRVEANGFCHPATLRVTGAGMAEDWSLGAPDCGVLDGP